jgi:hypothetical protein
MSKKVGAANWVWPVVGVAAVGGILWWLYKNGGIPGLLESGAGAANNQGVQAATQAAGASLSIQGQTRSDADINGIATTIFNAGSSNDGGAIAAALGGLGNQADYNRLYQLFGTKKASTSSFSTCNLLGFDCQDFDLVAWVDAIVSADQKNEINSMLAANGITSQF